jgi:two-component system, OmpR family, KDP operon response regulator KdpE
VKWLVIDDDQVNRTALAELLLLDGHEVETAATALDVIRRLHYSSPPDVVVLDVRLPDTDGLELLALLRRTPGWGRVPVVLATAAAEVTAPPDGPTALLLKPFGQDELWAAVLRAKSCSS